MAKAKTVVSGLRDKFGDGRQYGVELSDIKENHRNRYYWAANRLANKGVVDAGCGCGYGSWILAQDCAQVWGLDFNPNIIEFANKTWKRGQENLTFHQFDLNTEVIFSSSVVVAFEIIEHLVTPEQLLCTITPGTWLYGSVPSEEFHPCRVDSNPFHIRHYRHGEVEKLLCDCGYAYPEWFHQARGDVLSGRGAAQTIVFVARREKRTKSPSAKQHTTALLREFLKRCNAINSLKNGEKIRPETAY